MPKRNIAATERGITLALGTAFVIRGLLRRSYGAWALATVGVALASRALRGYCPVYGRLGLRTGAEMGEGGGAVTSPDALLVEKSVTIQRSPADLYRFWRDLENLPRCLSHVRAIRVEANGQSHWTVRGPAGMPVHWDAELMADIPNELLAWSTREGSDVRHDGAVRFVAAPGLRGTEVRVRLRYEPVGGKLAALVARLFGEDPAQQIGRDLRRLKQLLEAGEVATGSRRHV